MWDAPLLRLARLALSPLAALVQVAYGALPANHHAPLKPERVMVAVVRPTLEWVIAAFCAVTSSLLAIAAPPHSV